MARAVDARPDIEAQIASLEEAFGPFPVNQTTISVPEEQYLRVRDRPPGWIDAYVEVRAENGDVLHVRTDGSVELPSASLTLESGLESQVRAAVEEATGVTCSLAGVESASIAGLRNGDGEIGDTVYQLVAILGAAREGGQLGEDALWQSSPESIRPSYA